MFHMNFKIDVSQQVLAMEITFHVFCLACWTSVLGAHRVQPLNQTWSLVWSDEFDTGELNTTLWTVRKNESHCCGPEGQPELELYVPEQAYVEDGHLVLRTQRTRAVGPGGKIWNFTSGWVDTSGANGFAQKYGRFVANCSLPAMNATGVWPAFWLMPQNKSQCWPTGGEVDVFEFVGNPVDVDQIFGSYHWGTACGKDRAPIPGKGTRPDGLERDWQINWHTYAVEWSPDRLDFFLDDRLYFSRTSAEVDLPTSPMHIIFDQAVDNWLFNPKTGPAIYPPEGVFLRVDWVRVYQRTTTSPPLPRSSSGGHRERPHDHTP